MAHTYSLDGSKLLSAAEAADALGVSRDTFNRMVQRGDVHPIPRRGERRRRRRFTMAEVWRVIALDPADAAVGHRHEGLRHIAPGHRHAPRDSRVRAER